MSSQTVPRGSSIVSKMGSLPTCSKSMGSTLGSYSSFWGSSFTLAYPTLISWLKKNQKIGNTLLQNMEIQKKKYQPEHKIN